MRRFMILTTFLAAVTACAHGPKEDLPSTANPAEEITRLETDQQAAVREQVHVLSPGYYQASARALTEAKSRRDKGDPNDQIIEALERGRGNLRKANEIAAVSRTALGDVVAARRAAVDARAPELLGERWKQLDEDLRKVTDEIEDENLDLANAKKGELAKRYAEAEVAAVQLSALGKAAGNIRQARRENAEKAAPRTLKQVEELLKSAEAAIAANPRDKAMVDAKGQELTKESERLLVITREARVANVKDPESLVLEREQKNMALEKAANKAAQLEGTVTTLSAEASATKSQLEATKTFDGLFADAQAKITPAEGEVLRQGDNMIVRLKGLTFASGKSELASSNYALLQKVGGIVKGFGQGTRVTVEGHTDSVGGQKTNQKLSEQRAKAVADYMTASSDLQGITVTSRGLGFSKPIADNKTKEGRALNRRVDVIIQPGNAIAH